MFESLALPKVEDFVKGVEKDMETHAELAKPTREMERASLAQQAKRGVSDEFKGLLIQYCATYLQATELAEVDFKPLAVRLGTRLEFVEEAAKLSNVNDALWVEVLGERIKRVGAARTFRDFTWEKVESKALNMLGKLLDSNYIRDSGELLAIANQARKINVVDSGGHNGGGNVNVNFNLGGAEMDGGLPASGAKMTIDLSPRLATSLATRNPASNRSERIIDSKMISAQELREVLELKTAESTRQKEA